MASRRVALVTGSGKRRVGWYVADALARRGYGIVVHYHSAPAEAEATAAHFRAHGVDVIVHQADLGNEDAARGLVRTALDHFGRLDVLVNCASVWYARRFEDVTAADVRRNFEANVLGTSRVLDAARRGGIANVVLASTGGALIGDATPPVDERSLPKPISPYGASKLAGEGYAHAFAKTYGLRTVAIRFGNVYGPWCARKRGVLNVFFESIHDGVPMVIYGDGSASRDYVHVDDISGALQLALEKDVPGGTVLHAASGVETAVRDLADLCRRAAGAPDHPVEYRPKRAGEVERNFASYDLANQLLGYAPSVAREDGIPRLWQWFSDEVFRG